MAGLAFKNAGPGTMVTGEAVVADRLVLISSSTLKYADGGEEPIGLTQEPVASGALCAYEFLDAGIHKVTGSKAITAGTAIYCTTDGKVSDAAVGKQIGIVLEAITGDGGKASAILWGPRGGNDIFASPINTIIKFEDDFFWFDDGDDWVDTVSDGGTVEVTDAVGGILSIASTGNDNDESYVSLKAEAFTFSTTKKVYFQCRIKLTEANTDDANWIIGLSSIAAANTLVDDGAGVVTTYDGAVFYKVDGTLTFMFETSNAATQVDNADVGVAFASATWYTLSFLYDYGDGTTGSITPYIDGVAGTAHAITIAGLEEMHVVMGVKAGAGNAETLLVDYVHVQQER